MNKEGESRENSSFLLSIPFGEAKNGEGVSHRHPLAIEAGQLLSNFEPHLQTLLDNFFYAVDKFGKFALKFILHFYLIF